MRIATSGSPAPPYAVGPARSWRRWPLVVLGLALAPLPALAHEKWFTQDRVHPTDWSLVLSERTALAVAGLGLALLVLWLLQRLAGDPAWPRLGFFHRMAHGAITLLAVQTAITLIAMGASMVFLAPQLQLAPNPLGLALAAAQIAIAFSFITGLLDRAGAIALLALWLVGFALFPVAEVFGQLIYVGIAVTLFIVGRTAFLVEGPRAPFDAPDWGVRAVAALRVLSGASLLIVAFTDKVWNPDLGLAFLAEHPRFNILRQAGLEWFTDERFQMLAGVVEASIGALLMSGLLTRVVILGMWVPFNVTVPFLPPVEMIGHLPIFGAMYLLLVYGRGAITPGTRLPTEEERADA